MRPRFARKLRWLAAVLLVLALTASWIPQALAVGTIGTNAGFEDNDGNLTPAAPINFDWNSFRVNSTTPTWTGTAPYQTADETLNGWHFVGLTDAQKSSSDTGFAGGTKQDANCAPVIGTSAPNKDDLKRIYVAHKTVNVLSDNNKPHIFLELAWVRITQNTASSSAHVAFEFNQGTTACPTGSDGLVQRTAGDLLFIYDFTGGSSGVATLTVRKWVLTGACDISSDSAPCWGLAQDLTASGFAEAAVDSGAVGPPAFPFPVSDTVAPTTESLGQSEFGEAGADLTAAGLFSSNVCTSFGQVEGVSRSSGNSGQAAMEDLVGPGDITISNCGTLIVKKVTDPSPPLTNTSFNFTVDGPATQDGYTLPQSFSLVDQGTKSFQVFAGNTYSAAETVPANWQLETASCSNGSGTLSGSTISNISVGQDETVTCTFTDKPILGAIKITKTSSKGTHPTLQGATFSISGPSSFSTSVTTGSDGTACVEHLPFGDYSVTETAAPTGYSIDDTSAHPVTVSTQALCGDPTYVGQSTSFTDTPLSDIQVRFRDDGSGATSATITCDNTTGTDSTANTTGWDKTLTVTGVKAPTTIHCTIVIDP